MIPDLIDIDKAPWKLLPAGIHKATIAEIKAKFVYNPKRTLLFSGLMNGIQELRNAGCGQMYLNGSFVTSKPNPGDYDVCWNPINVKAMLLDPVLLEFDNERKAQKAKFYGEYFPTTHIELKSGHTFLEFFQTDKDTGQPKGIIEIYPV